MQLYEGDTFFIADIHRKSTTNVYYARNPMCCDTSNAKSGLYFNLTG